MWCYDRLGLMTYHKMPLRKLDTPMPWDFVFIRWLNDHLALDYIEYADVPRFVGQINDFDVVGPIKTVARKEG